MQTPKIDYKKALCTTQYAGQSHLWDEELDGGSVKNARGETPEQREIRHAVAKAVCNTCPEKLTCRWIGLNDPKARGVYGGELV